MKMFDICVHMHIFFVYGLILWIWLERVYFIQEVLKWAFACDSLMVLRWCCAVKIQLLFSCWFSTLLWVRDNWTTLGTSIQLLMLTFTMMLVVSLPRFIFYHNLCLGSWTIYPRLFFLRTSPTLIMMVSILVYPKVVVFSWRTFPASVLMLTINFGLPKAVFFLGRTSTIPSYNAGLFV